MIVFLKENLFDGVKIQVADRKIAIQNQKKILEVTFNGVARNDPLFLITFCIPYIFI